MSRSYTSSPHMACRGTAIFYKSEKLCATKKASNLTDETVNFGMFITETKVRYTALTLLRMVSEVLNGLRSLAALEMTCLGGMQSRELDSNIRRMKDNIRA
jgi:hypothetical protein